MRCVTLLLRFVGILFVLLTLLQAPGAWARRYPINKSDASGTWVGTRQGLLHGTGELWKRYGVQEGLPASRVTDVELSARSVWVATTKGLARLDKGSRRWEVFAEPKLPSGHVTAVSVDPSDPDHVWVGTQGGLAHYNVRTNTWQRLTQKSGLPADRVNDVLFRGRTVWVATEGGLAAHDVKLDTWTVYSEKHGLAGNRVLEIDEQGTDLWFTSDKGLSRMNLQRRTFSPFRTKEGLPSTHILSQVRMQNLIYFITDKGLITYDTSSDALGPFLFAKGLLGAQVRSVASAGGFVWFATSKGLCRFEPTKKAWEYYRVEDGLSTDDLQRVTPAGSYLLVFGSAGELDSYDYKKDEWVERSGLVGQPEETQEQTEASDSTASQPATRPGEHEDRGSPGLELTTSAELDTELKQDFRWLQDQEEVEREGYWLVNTLRLGAGMEKNGRSVDLSGKLDWGDISPLFKQDASTLESFQRYDVRLRYLGRQDDLLQEVIASNQLRLEPEGGQLTERTELEGGRVVVAGGPKRAAGPMATVQVAGGLRRGMPMRVVFRRPEVGSLQIKRFKLFKPGEDGSAQEVRYVIPSSVRALLDGKELERNVDYFVDHENGVLWVKNTDLVHTLRVLEVEFEYEQIPRKNVGAVSMTDLLPRDGDIGQLKRSGQARWAKDEQGLFDEIDGGAEQYINRGWDKTLSQDFEWGSAGVILRIHDMGDEKNASSIFLVRKLPDAKPVPGLEGVYIEKQASSLSIKLVRGQFFVEISIDQAAMEQEILSIAGWLVGKLEASGSTSADALRDAVISAMASLRLTDNTSIGLSYIGARSVEDAEVRKLPQVMGMARDVLALHASHSRRLSDRTKLSAGIQTGASLSLEDNTERFGGSGVLGQALLTNPRLNLRMAARKYSENYAGIGVARQTEFCRSASGTCRTPGTSRLDHEVGADATVRGASWLPVSLTWQRQSSQLGRDWNDAPQTRERTGLRDVALGQVGLDHASWPKVSVGGGYIRREDPLAQQGQLRGTGALEADLAEGLLKALTFKKLFLRGLYEFGRNDVDEYRTQAADEQDRVESMHHAVGELRLAPSLTESAYATLEYHSLRGALDADRSIADLLTYWRLDTGAGSSVIPGIALRFDGTIWFGDDQPFARPDPTTGSLAVERKQEADSRLSGVIDLFPGEWFGKLSPIKLNGAYTYTLQSASEGRRQGLVSTDGREVCDNGQDDDGDGVADCEDPDCAMADVCLIIQGELESHRAYGTLFWDTPGKIQVELFGDSRWSYSRKAGEEEGESEQLLRATRHEIRSFVTWRPIYSSPLTLRMDALREVTQPETYDGISSEDPVKPNVLTLEPALEWRRRWSERWWHLAKLTLSHSRFRDQPHIRTIEDAFGKKGDLERLDFDIWTIKPSLEIRRKFEDPQGIWNFRPYIRASYAYQWGRGVRSRIEDREYLAGDPGLSDGSDTNGLMSVSVGLIWVHAENVFVDLDLNTSYLDCRRAPTGAGCNDKITFTPHLLATVRY